MDRMLITSLNRGKTYIEFVSLHNFWWRIVGVIVCLVVLVPFKPLQSYDNDDHMTVTWDQCSN
jgi:hypothetical protein